MSASWNVPADATSGIYFAKLVREDAAGSSHVFFIVRDDDGRSDLLFQTSDTTWQAYNRYGGNSLYAGSPAGRAYKVSYNRPFTTRGTSEEDWLFNSEYPMVRWLERNGYDVSYFTGVDSDRLGAEIREHKAFLSVGHDEYWSGAQRANVEAARDAGVNLAFFSGNEVFWKTRWEDGHRTLVSYKETHANAKIDPTATWTGTWRDARSFNPEGAQPENALTGTIFTVNSGTRSIQVPAEEGRLRLWRNTTAAGLAPGQTETLGQDTLGYEWDEDLDNGARPAGPRPPLLDDGRRRPEAAGLRQHPRTRHRDAPPDPVSGHERRRPGRARLRRRDRAVVLGPRRRAQRRPCAGQPHDATGHGQPVRRHGRAGDHAAARARAPDPVHRHDAAERGHQRSGRRGYRRATQTDADHGHRDGRRRPCRRG